MRESKQVILNLCLEDPNICDVLVSSLQLSFTVVWHLATPNTHFSEWWRSYSHFESCMNNSENTCKNGSWKNNINTFPLGVPEIKIYTKKGSVEVGICWSTQFPAAPRIKSDFKNYVLDSVKYIRNSSRFKNLKCMVLL